MGSRRTVHEKGRPGGRIVHVWVHSPGRVYSGLAVEWRRGPGGQEARVVYVDESGDGTLVVERWLPARFVTPAHAQLTEMDF